MLLIGPTSTRIDGVMNMTRRRKQCLGQAAFELVVSLPLIGLTLMLLFALGRVAIVRQQAAVAARFSAYYQTLGNTVPDSGTLSAAVSPMAETWQPTCAPCSTADLQSHGNFGSSGVFLDFLSWVNDFVAQTSATRCTAQATPNQRFAASLFGVGAVTAEHYLSIGFWNSGDQKYRNQLPVVPIIGGALGGR